MADEILRMQAEVQDRYSGPLKALRAQLLDTARTGANHSETLAKGFKAVEGTMQSTARTASSVVNPAFAALGVTGLSAGAAVAGISNALNKLTGSMLSLGALSRETGVAAKTLQEFGSVAGRFGIEQDAVASATKNFAAQMRTFSIGTGEAFRWVMQQGRDASGRKAFQDFATDLQHTSDEGEKLKKALAFMETIRNPVERGIFAQQFFGNQDLGRIADGHLGRVVDLFKKAREKLGEFKPEDIIDAEKFDRSVSSLRSSMQRFGLTVARELLGPATQFTTWMDSLVSGERADVTKSLREGLQGVKKELGEINWKQFGEDTVQGLQAGTALAGSLAKAMHEIAETIHSLRSGNYAEAFSHADSVAGPVLPGKDPGADGPLRRRLAPRLGDDEIEARQRVEDLKKLRAAAVEAQGHFIGRTQQRMGLLGAPGSYDKDLDAAQAKLKALEGRTPEQRKQEFEASEKLRKALDANTEELKASRNGATVQKQSMDTQGGLFGGATVQTAGFGSGFRRFGGYGGGSGPGYAGEQGPAGSGVGRGFGGGRFNGLGGGSRPQGMDPNGEGGRRAQALRPGVAGSPGGRSRVGGWWTAERQQHAYDRLRAGGVSDLGARALIARWSAVEAGGGPASVNPRSGAFGIGQWLSRDRLAPIKGNTNFDDQLSHALRELHGPEGRALAQLNRSTNEAEAAAGASMYERAEGYNARSGVDNFTSATATAMRHLRIGRQGSGAQDAGGDADFFPNGTPRVLKPNSMGGAPGLTMDEANRHREALKNAFIRRAEVLADPNDERRRGDKPFYSDEDDRRAARDLGIALRATRAKQEAQREQMRLDGARVGAAAAQAGVVGAQVNGSVTTVIEKAGPEAKARTSVNGNLFQEVRPQNGSQMRKAD